MPAHAFCGNTRNEEKRRKAGVTKIGAAVAIAAEKSGPAKETLKRKFLDSLFYMQGKFPALATRRDYYMALEHEAGLAYADRERWSQMSILNTARSGKFSSDRTIREYAEQIWHAKPVPIKMLSRDDVKGKFLQ